MQDVIQMPKIVVNVYSALILVLDSKIQDIGKETVKLHHVKISMPQSSHLMMFLLHKVLD